MGRSICSSKGKHFIPIPVRGQKSIPNSVEKGTGTGMDPYPASGTLDFCRIAQIQRGVVESHEWSIDAWKKEERDFDLKPTFSTQQEVEPMSKSTAMFHVTVLPYFSFLAKLIVGIGQIPL